MNTTRPNRVRLAIGVAAIFGAACASVPVVFGQLVTPHCFGWRVQTRSGDLNSSFLVRPDTNNLDFGNIPTMKSATAKLRIVNHDKVPRTLRRVIEKTAPILKLREPIELPPGQSVELEYSMAGGVRPGPILNRSVTIICDGQPELLVPVRAYSVSFVEVEPETINLDRDRVICLRSIDGTPFRVRYAVPNCIDMVAESKHEHIIALHPEILRSQELGRTCLVYLDHPQCEVVCVNWTE